jgi:hypothetical protein
MIIDVSFFSELYNAEKANSYDALMLYMKQFSYSWYEKMHIMIDEHYYYEQLLYLPISIHFKAHILLARESIDFNKTLNYCKAIQIVNKVSYLKSIFKEEIKEAKQYFKKNIIGNYIEQHGPIKAAKRRLKLSNSMKSLNENIIRNRNRSIKLYAANRPASHNQAISNSRKKSIIELNSGIIYKSALEASLSLNIPIHTIRRGCKLQIPVKGKFKFSYMTEI